MRTIFRTFAKLAAVGGLAALVLQTSCRKRDAAARHDAAPVVAPELLANQTATLPGTVYRSQAKSRIHWQPWTKETLALADAAKRLVFLVIALPQYGGYHAVLEEIESTPALVDIINSQYVPVLVDGDAAREMAILCADLCVEINKPVQLPLFAWLSPEGNPVGWIPVPSGAPGNVRMLFDKSHSMISESWANVRKYVYENSAIDNRNRAERITRRNTIELASEQPADDVVRAIRQLTSLYDPIARSFDETGGLFPTGAIEILSTAAMCRGLAADDRSRCLRTLRETLADLLPSAMFDPLDGGLYAARRGLSWALPAFERDCNRQALAVTVLCRAYQATGDLRALSRALGVLDFIERNYRTEGGLFALGGAPPKPIRHHLWTVDEVREVLPQEDAAWWIAATGMTPLGNLPSEADPRREFFRCNSFGMAKSPAELAAGMGLSTEAFAARYEAARKRLLEARDARLGTSPRDTEPHATSCFRVVSAYCAAYTATGDTAYRDKAAALLKLAQETFSEGADLWQFATRTAPSVSAGRAFLYGLALQAVLDVMDVTGDEAWARWGDDLAATSAERFAQEGFLRECPKNAEVMDLPITDLVMLFDESSAGLVSSNESRMAARGRPLVESLSKLATPLPTITLRRPVLHTDLIMATLIRHHGTLALIGTGVSPELKSALAALPLRSGGFPRASGAVMPPPSRSNQGSVTIRPVSAR
ncbi:MAG: DUF255 domain-containing protein [Akkermansiaceae bacterium]|nr:DUF255 domain-containing protein [Akkermansiaceae bacterium]